MSFSFVTLLLLRLIQLKDRILLMGMTRQAMCDQL